MIIKNEIIFFILHWGTKIFFVVHGKCNLSETSQYTMASTVNPKLTRCSYVVVKSPNQSPRSKQLFHIIITFVPVVSQKYSKSYGFRF